MSPALGAREVEQVTNGARPHANVPRLRAVTWEPQDSAWQIDPSSGLTPLVACDIPPKFPLHSRPASVAVLDERGELRDEVAAMLPPEWQLLHCPGERFLLQALRERLPLIEQDYWSQRAVVDAWRAADSVSHSLPQLILAYWGSQPKGMAELPRVCVVEADGAGFSGKQRLSLLQDLAGFPLRKIFVAGSRDAALALAAFNAGLIDSSLKRESANFERELMEAVQGLMARPDSAVQQLWSSTLSRQQLALLDDDSVCRDLYGFATRTWLEWVVIGEPFGVMGRDRWGGTSWLQLEAVSELAIAAELAGAHGLPAHQVAEVRAGRALSDGELLQFLGVRDRRASGLPAFSIGEEGKLIGTLQRIRPTR